MFDLHYADSARAERYMIYAGRSALAAFITMLLTIHMGKPMTFWNASE